MRKTFAAIDVGSNAVRMLIASQGGSTDLPTPLKSIRLPIRLGQDAFTQGWVGETLALAITNAFVQFRQAADSFGVSHLRAVATSALRESDNASEIIAKVASAANITIEIISGEEEARLVQLAVNASLPLNDTRAMLIDIGGGSVEVTFTDHGEITSAESYPLGTVRLLRKLTGNNENPDPRLLHEFTKTARSRVITNLAGKPILTCVGTGGNIEEMGSLAKRLFKSKTDRSISFTDLTRLIDLLSQYTPTQRAEKFNLRPDRADVILPAAMVLRALVNQIYVKSIQIPNVGLKEGVLLDMMANETSPSPPVDPSMGKSVEQHGEKIYDDRDDQGAAEE